MNDDYLKQHGHKRCVIYVITNTLNGKLYVGQTVKRVRTRWAEHKRSSIPGTGYVKNTAIAHALQKYGVETFTIRVVEECTPELLNSREAFWINYYGAMVPRGYNLTAGGDSAHRAPEVGRKISAANKGRVKGPEWRAALSRAHMGKVLSAETRIKISEVQRGRKHSPETIAKRSASLRGHKSGPPHSDETKRKISESLKRFYGQQASA